MYVIGNLILGLTTVLDSVLFIYSIIVIASVIISWVNADPNNPIVRTINMLTEPVFAKVRSRIPHIPAIGAIDLTPIAVILAIMFIQAGVLPSLTRFALSLL